jgi:4-alpha-glucanotransferase
LPLRWKIVAGLKVIAQGETGDRTITWPADLPVGSYRLHLTDVSLLSEEVPLIVAPPKAFGGDFDRSWILAVQLYGVRSSRNWGMGDFTDLEGLIELAAGLGAGGVGLNPLHALFDDRPGDCSPYSPNSRLFLNALYIDVEKLAEVSSSAFAESSDAIARLRESDIVDYVAIAELKWRALRSAFAAFKANPKTKRQAAFAKFRAEGTVVGMAGSVAAPGRHPMRKTSRRSGCGRDRIRRIRSMDGGPATAIMPGSGDEARHEGRSLPRRGRRRAIRRVRRLE